MSSNPNVFKTSILGILRNSMFWVAAAGASQVLALIYTIHSYEKTIQVNHYDAIDKMYFDLRKISYENSAMNQPGSLSGENKKKYEFYAEMTFNFLETIYDRSKEDNELKRIWYGVIQAEYKVHKRWIIEGNARAYYDPHFMKFLKRFDSEDLENIITTE